MLLAKEEDISKVVTDLLGHLLKIAENKTNTGHLLNILGKVISITIIEREEHSEQSLVAIQSIVDVLFILSSRIN